MRSGVLVLCVLAAGCAGQPKVSSELGPATPVNRQQADARTRADLRTQLGAGYYELRNFRVALEELQEALRIDPTFVPAHNVLALVYMELREDGLAQQSFERALQLSPQDSETNNNYGWFLCQRKRYDEAMKHFMIAVKNPLYQTPEKAFINAGVCSRERGDIAGAIQHLQRALALQPGNGTAHYQLAEIAFARGQVREARDHMNEIVKSGAPFNAEALWLALRIERMLGNTEAEASYGVQLRRNFPKSRETQALINRQYE